MALGPSVEFIKKYRKDGTQIPLSTILDEIAPTAIVHPDDVGRFAAVLLSLEDPSPHNKAKYEINGPVDFNGKQLKSLVEEVIGTKVENVKYRDLDFLDTWAENAKEHKSHILSIKHAPVTGWDGKTSTATTSKEFLELSPPQITPAQYLKSVFQD